MNYVLIGMPASGKTTMGKRLANGMGLCFVDTDQLLLKLTGMDPGGLKGKYNFNEFVRKEEQVVCSLSGQGMVIATGGSVVYSKKAMRHLEAMGTIIYLEDSFKNISRRVGHLDKRGVILRPGQNFYGLYRERCQLYTRYAQITLRNYWMRPAQSCYELMKILRFIQEA